MATKGVELASAYISLSVSTDDVPRQVSKALDQAARGATGAGRRIGQNMADEIGSQGASAGRRFSDNVSRTAGQGGSKAALKFTDEFRTTSERVGAGIGLVIGKTVGGAIRLDQAILGQQGAAEKAGSRLARTFSGAFTSALAFGGVGSIGAVLFSGFDRLSKIDAATKKLEALNSSAQKFNKPLIDVKKTVQDVTDVVTGTPFSLDQAFDTAVSGIGAGVTDIKRYMKDVVDAAGFANTSVGDLGLVFQQIVNKGNLTGEELAQLNERFPATSWIQESYHLTADQFEKMRDDGELTLDMLEKSIEDHAAGMGQKLGEGLGGAVEKMKTSVARIGADLITTVFGGTTGDTSTLTNSINTITGKFNDLDNWLKAHSGDIHQFFVDAGDAAKPLAGAVGDIADILRRHPQLIRDVGIALGAVFVVSKLSGFIGGLSTISGMLGGKGSGILGQLGLLAGGFAAINGAAGGDPRMSALGTIGAGAGLGAQFGGLPGAAIGTAVGGVGAMVPTIVKGFQDENRGFQGSKGAPGVPYDPNAIVGGAAGGQGTPGRNPLDVIAGQATPSAGAAPQQSLDGFLGIGGGAGPGGVRGGMPQGLPAAATGSAKGGPESWRPLVRSVIAQYGPQMGITNPKAWEDAIVRQIGTESGGNPSAINLSDSNAAAGHPSQGLLQFIPSTFAAHNISGGSYLDPAAQIAAVLSYVPKAWGVGPDGSPNRIGRGVGYATGGGVSGQSGKDKVPAWLTSGEHVLTTSDVAAMGGQPGVYAFRNALHRAGGGAVAPWMLAQLPGVPEEPKPHTRLGKEPGLRPNLTPGPGYPGVIAYPDWGVPGTTWGPPPDSWWLNPVNPNDILNPDLMPPGQRDEWLKRWGKNAKRIKPLGAALGFADGGAVPGNQITPEMLQQLQNAGIDPSTIPPDQLPAVLQQLPQSAGTGSTGRTEGYIPAGAGYTGKTGAGIAGGLINLGASAINGAIDAAAQAASMAATAAIAAGSFGAGAAAGPAASSAIQMGAAAAKRGVQYGAEMANIGIGALTEILMPFGAPRWLSDVDPTSFIPNMGGSPIATTAAEALQGMAGPGRGPDQQSAVDPNTLVHGQAQGAPPGPPPGPVPPAPTNAGGAPPIPTAPTNPPGVGGQPAPTPAAAPAPQNDPMAFLKQFGIFDSGGVLQPNSGAINLSNRPEYVFTQSQWDKMGATASHPGGGTTYNVYANDMNEALRELKKHERRASGPLMRGKAGL